MKAIYKAPLEPPKIIDIDNTLEALQAAVGGYIETVTISADCCIICDESGRLLNRPVNCRLGGVIFYGPILIVGVTGDEFTGLLRPEYVARLFFGDGCV